MGSCNSCYQDKNKEVVTKDKVIISHSEQKENKVSNSPMVKNHSPLKNNDERVNKNIIDESKKEDNNKKRIDHKLNDYNSKVEINIEVKSKDKLTLSSIYILKNENIKFFVLGSWKFIKNEKEVDYQGHKNMPKIQNYYIGELLGKIGDEIFSITDNFERKFNSSGELYLYPNIGEVIIEPKGSLQVKVIGGNQITSTKPIEEFELEEFPKEKYSFLIVKAGQLLLEYPLYVTKGDKLKFHVRGTWSFDKDSITDCKGHADFGNENDGYFLGQLMGEIGGQKMAIIDNFTLYSKTSGQLYLYPNVGEFELIPSGSLRVYIEGGKKIENVSDLDKFMKENVPKDSIEINVKASDKEQDFNVWVKKDQKIKFIVKGKWTVYEEMDKVDYNGREDLGDPNLGFYIGALISRVLGSKQYFIVKDGLEYKSTTSGPLIFQMNNSNYALSPSGSLSVFITGAEKKSQTQIEHELGYDLNKRDTACNESYLTLQEKRQFIYLNKIRLNPPRFAELYLIHRINNPGYSKETYDELKATKPMKPLYPSKALYLAARDHAKDMGENGKEGHISTNGDDLGKRIEKYGKVEITCGENCAYGYEDGLTNVIQLLIDDGVETRGHRKNILNPDYGLAGIAIYKHKTYIWNCVHDYAGGIVEKDIMNYK